MHLFLALFGGSRIQYLPIIKLLTDLLQFKLHFKFCTYFYTLIYFTVNFLSQRSLPVTLHLLSLSLSLSFSHTFSLSLSLSLSLCRVYWLFPHSKPTIHAPGPHAKKLCYEYEILSKQRSQPPRSRIQFEPRPPTALRDYLSFQQRYVPYKSFPISSLHCEQSSSYNDHKKITCN